MTETQRTQKSNYPNDLPDDLPSASLNIGLETVFLLLVTGVLLVDKLVRPTIVKSLGGVFAPIEEERELNSILAQIGLMTKASRVILAAFHNGTIDKAGYHLAKLTTINTYIANGHEPMAKPIRGLPIGTFIDEIEVMIQASHAGNAWTFTGYDEKLPQPCKDHLIGSDIGKMYSKLIRIGNLPIGILSIQYSFTDRRKAAIEAEESSKALEEMYNRICSIMRRRVIKPSIAKRIYMLLTGKWPWALYSG